MAKPKAVIKTSTLLNPKGGLLRTRHYFQVVGSNGENQCTSEMYSSRSNACRGVHDLASSLREDYEIRQ